MRKFLVWCSKYISLAGITIIGLIVYILFIQENSVNKLYELNRNIDSLNIAIQKENDTLSVYNRLNRQLDLNDPQAVERVVREQHNLSRANEDVFVFD